MGSDGEQFDAGDALTAARLNQKTITADTGANCTADTKYAGMIFVPSTSNGSFVADQPAYIKSDASTVEILAGLTLTQTMTNKTLTSPTINTPTIATPTITSPTISNPKMQFITRWAYPLPPILGLYSDGFADGAGAVTQVAGALDLETDTTGGDSAGVSSGTGAAFLRGDRAFELTLGINLETVTSCEVEIGVVDDASPGALLTSADAHASIVFDDSTSNNWIMRNANTSAQTSTTSSTAATTGFHTVTILNTESAIAFYVDGTSLGTAHTTNLPTSQTMGVFCVIHTETTAAKAMQYLGGMLYIDAA